MHATVTLRTQDGELHQLGHGDLVGRLWSAALPLSSPHVSEAHAMVSLRGGHLHMLSLRGLFAFRGKPSKDLVLAAGQRISFARDVHVDVMDVTLPEEVLGIEGDGLARQPLPGVASLRLTPQPVVLPGARDRSVAVFWSTGDGWTVRTEAGEQPLEAGWTLEHSGGRVRTLTLKLAQASQAPTGVVGRVDAPLRVETHWDTVHLHREGHPTLTLTGHPARILSELGSMGTSVPWEHVAQQLWGDITDRHLLRKRFDTVLARLRRKLRGAGLRPDLVKPDGAGNLALVLRPSDRLDDRS